jgi:IgGFc binding protein
MPIVARLRIRSKRRVGVRTLRNGDTFPAARLGSNSARSSSVRSQDDRHPIWLFGHMTSCTGPPCLGDPDFVNVPPAAQFLDRYSFVVDPSFRNSSLSVVRARAEDSKFKPVTLSCLGDVTGWTPLGTSDKYEYAYVALTNAFAPVGKCNAGRNAMESDGPFGVTVWGMDEAASYGYPGGASVRALNNIPTGIILR